jgi:hypothetical protein
MRDEFREFHSFAKRPRLRKKRVSRSTTVVFGNSKPVLWVGFTASLDSQFFSQEFCGKWDSFLAEISVPVSRISREREKRDILCNLRDLQTSKIIIHSEKLVLDPKFLQDSRKTPELKLVMILASLATKFLFARLASLATKFVWRLANLATKFICETGEKRVLLRNFFLRVS